MLIIDKENKRFNFRVAGIAIHDKKVLLHQYDDPNNFYAFPGGRAEMFESTEDTLIREMKEELEEDITIERLLYVSENFFDHRGKHVHEMCFYYLIHFDEDAEIHKRGDYFERDEIDGCKLYFSWIDIESVKEKEMYPEFIKKEIGDLPTALKHIVMDEIGREHVR